MAEWTPPSSGPMTPEWAQANVLDNLSALREDSQAQAATLGALAGVPSGLIAAFQNAASIAAGWSRFSNLDGRIPVGAGVTFGQTFAEGAGAGSSWAHQHAGTGLSADAASGGGSVSSGGGASADVNDHTHPISGNTANATWIPPSFGVVFAIKA